jgi:acetyl esterase/lipase
VGSAFDDTAWEDFMPQKESAAGKASLLGIVVRESIRLLLRILPLGEGGLLGAQKAPPVIKSRWRAPKGYTNTRYELPDCAVEILRQQSGSDTVIYQLHGGAYIFGFYDLYRRNAVRWSKLTGNAAVASLDYRLAPRHTYPAALEDALTGWRFLLEQGYKPDNILLVGDSAGGNLALALLLKLRDEGRALPRAVVVMSPWADLSGEGKSHRENIYLDPMFGIPRRKPVPATASRPAYAGGTDLHDPYLSPVYAACEGFPPMLIQAGTWEVLASDSKTVYVKLGRPASK